MIFEWNKNYKLVNKDLDKRGKKWEKLSKKWEDYSSWNSKQEPK